MTSPQVALISALVVGLVAFFTIQQKRRADARAQWWSRAQWAMDYLLTGDDLSSTVAATAVERLAELRKVPEADRSFLRAMLVPVNDPLLNVRADDADLPAGGDVELGRASSVGSPGVAKFRDETVRVLWVAASLVAWGVGLGATTTAAAVTGWRTVQRARHGRQ